MEHNEKLAETLEFLSSNEFLKIGKAITSKNWNIAMMSYRRIEKSVEALGLDAMKGQLPQLRMAIQEKNVLRGKNAMALLVARRVQLLNRLKEQHQAYEEEIL